MSSYEDFRARNVTLLSNSPLVAGSPWQRRGAPSRPGSAAGGASPSQSSFGGGTPHPAAGFLPRHLAELPSGTGRQAMQQSAGLSRFGAPPQFPGFPAPTLSGGAPSALRARGPLRWRPITLHDYFLCSREARAALLHVPARLHGPTSASFQGYQQSCWHCSLAGRCSSPATPTSGMCRLCLDASLWVLLLLQANAEHAFVPVVQQGGEALRAHTGVRAAAVAGPARAGPPASSPGQQRRRHGRHRHASWQQLPAGAKPGAAGAAGVDARALAGGDAPGDGGEGGTGLPGLGAGGSKKRARAADGSPGTPLLGAGLAAEPERRLRQRGDQARCAIICPLRVLMCMEGCARPRCSTVCRGCAVHAVQL